MKSEKQGELLDLLLANRGITSDQEKIAFFEPSYDRDCPVPFLLKDMDKAVARIEQAVENGEKITIYADYDADAVTAAAVLLRFFEKISYQNVDYYIPDRFTEGYGVNMEAIRALAAAGTRLVITVDCGINAFDAADLAVYLGMDMIITDHHQLTPHPLQKGEGEIPRALAVVNPYQSGDNYPFKHLTGVGVAFKLVQALTAKFQIKEGWEKWLLDLVAIGTVADCQMLLGENRVLVKWGLYVLKKSCWPGLRALLEVAGIKEQKLDTYQIAFMIAPRINAAGRIEHANLAIELLLCRSEEKAQELARKLDELNRHRQELTEQILSEAREQLLAHSDQKILMAAGSGWPKGIVGLVAGKLSEEFYRPVLVLEKGLHGEATGSARSIANFNIVEAIGQGRDVLMKFGGHPMAAGFTLRVEHIEIFYQKLLSYAETVLSEEDFSPELAYESEISLEQITSGLVNALEKFAPFGLGNSRPRFRINNLHPSKVMKIGADGRHLRMYIGDSENLPAGEAGRTIGCIGFNQGFWAEKLQSDQSIDIICEPQFNEWNGEKKIQLKIIDIDYSTSPYPSPSLPRVPEAGEVEP